MTSTTRKYDNSQREDLADFTRQRILTTAMDQISQGVASLTIPNVALEAGVSSRTIYRHFPTRDDLLDATWQALNEQLGEVPLELDLGGLCDFLPELFRRYAAIEDQIRSVIFSNVLQASRRRQGSKRAKALRGAIDVLISGADDRSNRMARSAAYFLTTPTTMIFLKDNYQLSTEEAAASAAWSLKTLVEGFRRNPPVVPNSR